MNPTNNPESPRNLRFGIFEVDLKSRELRRRGLKIKLSAQPFDFLVLLLEKSGDIVTREELRQKLWPSDTFVDFDHSVNAAVRRLRDALGESARNPSFIETVARIGYRFIGNVETLNNPASSNPQTRISSWHSPTFLVVISVVLVLAFFGARLMTKPENSPITSIPLVTCPVKEFSPSLSPNGQEVVLSWNGGSGTTSSLYEKVVGSEYLRLTTVANAIDFDPVWSPDGRETAFARVGNGATGLYIVSPLGGRERKLLNTAWSAAETNEVFSPGRLDWSPNGKSIVFSDRGRGEHRAALFLLSLDSMRSQQLTFPSFQTWDIDPKFSPDGRLVAFVRDTTGGQSIYVIPVTGGLERLLTCDSNPKIGLAWTEDQVRCEVGIRSGLGSRHFSPDGGIIHRAAVDHPQKRDGLISGRPQF